MTDWKTKFDEEFEPNNWHNSLTWTNRMITPSPDDIKSFITSLLEEVINEIPDDEVFIEEEANSIRLINTHNASKFKQQLKSKYL